MDELKDGDKILKMLNQQVVPESRSSKSFASRSTQSRPINQIFAPQTNLWLLFVALLSQFQTTQQQAASIRGFPGTPTTSNGLGLAQQQARVRLCVTQLDYNECLIMSNVANHGVGNTTGAQLSCVKARDRYECMKHIIDDKADIVNLNNEELYLAGRLYNLEPFAMEQYNGEVQHHKSVVLINQKANINSIADLRDKRSCHGSLNSTLGWDIPIGLLLATMTMSPDCRGELYTVGKFFNQSCAPEANHVDAQPTNSNSNANVNQTRKTNRPWSSDAYLDAELKRQHPSLCAACQNASLCSASDEFAGDEGALRCLLAGYGQVAFTSSKIVEKFLLAAEDKLADRRLLANYAYLCLDGKSRSLDSEPCEWAHKPTNVFVTSPQRSREEKEWFASYLRHLFFRYVPYKPSWWRMKSLFSDSTRVTQILPVPQHLQQWDKYLGNYISSIEKPLPGCEQNALIFCASNALEELKCLDLQKAAFSQRIRPEIDCKRAPSATSAGPPAGGSTTGTTLAAGKLECLEMVARRQADLVAVDLSSLHEASPAILQQLEPVAVSQQAYSDYAVAVVRADSGIKFLYQLAGRRSCHASFGDTASWLAPLAVLTERSLLGGDQCNKADQLADYFGGSCVPGAADLRINQYRSGSEKLCAICRGDSPLGQHQCERSHSERYHGQAGALRCLVEGAGEVAFVSLAALAANVDGRSQEQWARAIPLSMDSRNFRLVCRTGPSMLLNDYERCHLARLPGKVLVTNKFASREDKLTSRQLLTRIVDKFSSPTTVAPAGATLPDGGAGAGAGGGGGEVMFDLFGAYQNQSDLLFDGTTVRLMPLQLADGMSTFDTVERQYFDPSFRQLPLGQKSSSCKVVLTTSGASLNCHRQLLTLLLPLLLLVASVLMLNQRHQHLTGH